MNKERIEQIARECGVWTAEIVTDKPVRYPVRESIERFAQAIRNEALDEACKTVYGNCENDNAAQRTVDAIRRLKV